MPPVTFIAYSNKNQSHITNWQKQQQTNKQKTTTENSVNVDNIYCIEGNENVYYIITVIINIAYEADQEKMHEFVKPLSSNKHITMEM